MVQSPEKKESIKKDFKEKCQNLKVALHETKEDCRNRKSYCKLKWLVWNNCLIILITIRSNQSENQLDLAQIETARDREGHERETRSHRCLL